MDKFLCSKLAFDHFSGKEHIVEFETFAGNKFEFKTYEIEVALFGDDFHDPPKVETTRISASRVLQLPLHPEIHNIGRSILTLVKSCA